MLEYKEMTNTKNIASKGGDLQTEKVDQSQEKRTKEDLMQFVTKSDDV